MKTTREVIADMRQHYEGMKGSPAKAVLRAWVETLEESLEVGAETPRQTAPEARHGTFDVKASRNREVWVFGQRGAVVSADRCSVKPFGYYPDLDEA